MGPGSVNVLRCSLFPEEILEDEEDVEEVLPPISSFSSGSRVEEADGMGMGMGMGMDNTGQQMLGLLEDGEGSLMATKIGRAHV